MKKDRKKRLRRLAERNSRRREERRRETVSGVLRMTQSGFGFVIPSDADAVSAVSSNAESAAEIFVPPQYINGAIDGDEVQVTLLPPREDPAGGDRGPCGRITDILHRKYEEFVGELLPGNRIRPFNTRLPEDIRLGGSRHGAVRGDWARLKLARNASGSWIATVRQVIGRAGEVAADLDAVMSEYELPPRYSGEEDAVASALMPREIDRGDHTAETVVTIDPADAKDFDDALSVAPGDRPGTVEVGIHISDVAAYIAPRSRFDAAARRRGFSCYLPGRTLPMLPPGLTAKISLQIDQESPAHSVYLTIDETTGEVLSSRREHSLIRVKCRLDYDQVQDFLESGTEPVVPGWNAAVAATVRQLAGVAAALRRFRAERELFVELPLPEIRVLCDEKTNRIEGIEARTSRDSEQLVEEFMLAANSAVGAEMRQRGVAGIYRVHPSPEPEKTAEFCDLMETAFGLHPGDISDRRGCNSFIESLPDDPRRPVILNYLLRSMPRAGYSVNGDLHFALGKVNYAHFTSPIRRYSDLTVHQQLWNIDSGVRSRSKDTLEAVARECCEAEERVDNASFAANDRLKLRYLEELLEAGTDEMYEGVIVKVISAGLQVDVGALGLYGFVPKEQLRGEFTRSRFGINRLRQSSGINYKPGDYIYLRLARIDFARNSAVFVPAGR